MVISSTSPVLVSIQAVSPVSTLASLAAGAAAVAGAAAAGLPPGGTAGVCWATAGTASRRHTKRAGSSPRSFWIISKRLVVGFAGADAHGPLQVHDEHLAVTDLAGVGGADDGLDHLFGQVGRDRDLDLDLGKEVHVIFRPAVDLGLPLLAAETLHLRHGQALYPQRSQCFAHVVQLERFDDGHDQLHSASLDTSCAAALEGVTQEACRSAAPSFGRRCRTVATVDCLKCVQMVPRWGWTRSTYASWARGRSAARWPAASRLAGRGSRSWTGP